VSYRALVDDTDRALDAVIAHFGVSASWDREGALSELAYDAKARGRREYVPSQHERPPLTPLTRRRVEAVVGDLPEQLAALEAR
jgi:hypothetical protein